MGLLAAMEGELWQRQGFESFGDWRRASERARKAAKKAAAATKATAAALAPAALAPTLAPTLAPMAAEPPCNVEQDSPKPVRVKWQPLQQLDPPSPNCVNSPWAVEKLPGTLHEHVDMTPGGSRTHTIKHTSPSGTTRCEGYVSPAGARQALEERNAWRRNVTRARHEERAAREATAIDDELATADGVPTKTETWVCPLFGGEELELELSSSGRSASGYAGVHKINDTFKARVVCTRSEPGFRAGSYIEVWSSTDPRECAAVLAKRKRT